VSDTPTTKRLASDTPGPPCTFVPMSHGRGRACQSEGLHAGKPHFFSFLVLPCSMQSRLTFTTTPPITTARCSLLADCNLPFPGETARGTSQSSL
jgi:hypothetical protein